MSAPLFPPVPVPKGGPLFPTMEPKVVPKVPVALVPVPVPVPALPLGGGMGGFGNLFKPKSPLQPT